MLWWRLAGKSRRIEGAIFEGMVYNPEIIACSKGGTHDQYADRTHFWRGD